MSGPRRLAVFLSLVWVVFWVAASSFDPVFNWAAVFLFGVIPLAFVWGTLWVIAGFRSTTATTPQPLNGGLVVLVGFLAIVILRLLSVVAALENVHYGASLGMCDETPVIAIGGPGPDRDTCLHQTHTRTSNLWHLYYALISGSR